jgi:phage-related protein
MLPAIAQAMPGFLSLAKTILTVVVPALVQIWAAGQQFYRQVAQALIPVIEHMLPPLVKLAGEIAGGLSVALKFLVPYIVAAAKELLNFAGQIVTRVAPIVQQWFDNLMKGVNLLLAFWRATWPIFAPILKGLWDQLVGIVKIAWALLKGIILIGLDILSGNWKQAWTDFKDMLAGIWDGIKQVVHGQIESLEGIFTGLAGSAVQWGRNIISGLAAGLSASIGATNITGMVGHALGVPGFAEGVKNFAGGYAVVGEKGPELLKLPQGSSVYPLTGSASPSISQLSAAGGMQHFVVMLDSRMIGELTTKYQQKHVYLTTGVK